MPDIVASYALSNEAIGSFIQSIQAAILTGTDISDLIRMIRLEVDPTEGTLRPTADYIDMFNETMDQLSDRILAMEEEARATGKSVVVAVTGE